MCQSMVNIQSPTAEIRRGKKERRKKKEAGWKYKWSALLHRATIIKRCIWSVKALSPHQFSTWLFLKNTTYNTWLKVLIFESLARLRSNIPPHTHNRFAALFPGSPGWASARRELLDFMVQGKINRGRHTDHPAGRHSIRTNQCLPPPFPHIFYRPDALPADHPTASKHIKYSWYYPNLTFGESFF